MEEWMEAIQHNSIDNQFKALMELKFLKAKKQKISEDLIQFSNLLSSIEFCLLCDQGKEAVKAKYPLAVYEPSYKNIRFCLLTFQQHRSHTIIIVGSKWSSLNELKDQSKRKNNLPEYYGLLQIAKHIRRSFQKNLQKDFKVQIIGHCIGASIGLLVALLLHDKGVNVSSTIGFGAPQTITSEQISTFKDSSIPIVQVTNINDPIPRLFSGYNSVGSRLVLLKGAHYCWLESPSESEIEPSITPNDIEENAISFHSMDAYANSIREKVEFSVVVQYHLRSHYL